MTQRMSDDKMRLKSLLEAVAFVPHKGYTNGLYLYEGNALIYIKGETLILDEHGYEKSFPFTSWMRDILDNKQVNSLKNTTWIGDFNCEILGYDLDTKSIKVKQVGFREWDGYHTCLRNESYSIKELSIKEVNEVFQYLTSEDKEKVRAELKTTLKL